MESYFTLLITIGLGTAGPPCTLRLEFREDFSTWGPCDVDSFGGTWLSCKILFDLIKKNAWRANWPFQKRATNSSTTPFKQKNRCLQENPRNKLCMVSCHQEFQVPKMEVLNLIRQLWWWVFPYISRIHTPYIGVSYLHFRYLKCLVKLWVKPSHLPSLALLPPAPPILKTHGSGPARVSRWPFNAAHRWMRPFWISQGVLATSVGMFLLEDFCWIYIYIYKFIEMSYKIGPKTQF